jgi:hypothetical protein
MYVEDGDSGVHNLVGHRESLDHIFERWLVFFFLCTIQTPYQPAEGGYQCTYQNTSASMNLRKMYELFSYTMTQAEFAAYCDQSNEACRLLQAHFVALQLLMSPITKNEWVAKEAQTGQKDDGNGKTVLWLVGLHRGVRPDMVRYYRWTLWVQKEVLSGRLYNGAVKDEALMAQ